MNCRTLKYTRALEIDSEFTHLSSDELCNHLQDKGCYWDSNISRWVYTPGEQNDPASQLIKIRVMFDKNQVKEVADKITELLTDFGYRFVESSSIYPCRPPKGNDGRIYLTFQAPEIIQCVMKPDKTMICIDRSILENIFKDLLTLTDESIELVRYHHLVVVASTDDSDSPPDVQIENCLFLLNLYLTEWDRERITKFSKSLGQAHQTLREVLR
jgi:hypothetical protein